MNKNQISSITLKDICYRLTERYHSKSKLIQNSLEKLSSAQFLRLFIITNGMPPSGQWLTHTYCRMVDDLTQKHHFFLIPKNKSIENLANISVQNGKLTIDEFETNVTLQKIPHTTPFWYFHYNPNTEDMPYQSLTLNLSPDCLEKCVLCAGAKTGRINNGMKETLDPKIISKRIFNLHPEARKQLDSVAVVTGCFESFTLLESHLREVKQSICHYATPSSYRVLEHNVTTEAQFSSIVGELGYEIFITLECFDQQIRNIALNGKVGRKGRNSEDYVEMLNNYVDYLEKHQHIIQPWVRITYLTGLDSLETTEQFFARLAKINQRLKKTKIVPWMSIFTSYNRAMAYLQHKEFGLEFLITMIDLANQYFGCQTMMNESGGTSDGYARGLY